jgi:hypothetical protein
MGAEGMSDYESLTGTVSALDSGANSDISIAGRSGKGGLTNMAQAEVSYRDRAMQNSQKLTQFSAGDGAMDAATLLLRLQALKLRNAEVDSKLKQLHANPGQTSVLADNASLQVSTANLAQSATSPSGEASVLDRISQLVSQSVAMIAKPRQAQAGYAEAALT